MKRLGENLFLNKFRTKIFFASDIHGSESCFHKFLNAAKFYDANVLILGGDLTGKQLVPIIKRPSYYEANYSGKSERLNTLSEVAALEKSFRNFGIYTCRCSDEEYNELILSSSYREAIFSKIIKNSIFSWVEIAEERLKKNNIKLFMMPGNDDIWDIDEIIEQSTLIINPLKSPQQIGGFNLISLDYSNPTPWNSYREAKEADLEKMILEQIRMLDRTDKLIFNIHVPPYSSGLDLAPELNSNLEPVIGPTGNCLIPVGSTAVRSLIETYEPTVTFHGHVHESRGYVHLGNSLCINPGSEYLIGSLNGALVELQDDRVIRFQLTRG